MNKNERDKLIVELKCDRCGVPIQIKYGTYRKTRESPHYCRKCRGELESLRINSLPPEEKEKYLSSKNQAISDGWAKQSDEKKIEISLKRIELWKDPLRRELQSEMLQNRWVNLPEEEKIRRLGLIHHGRDIYWSNPENIIKAILNGRERWYSQPEEVRNRVLKALNDARIEFYKNLSKEEEKELHRKQGKSMKKYWDDLPENEYFERIRKFKESIRMHLNLLDVYPNGNESEFINYLDMFKIPYEWLWTNEYEYDKFYEIFPKEHPFKPGGKVTWFHTWDFIIHVKTGDILVDIDGSIHDPSKNRNKVTDSQGNKYILGDYIDFKDSQRVFQTDGLDAFIVQVFDDKLTKDTPVINVYTEKSMTLIDFLMYLNVMNE